MSDILLSLIIPTLNRPEKLSALVEKISNLSTPEVEWIIIDDSMQRWKGADSGLTWKNQVYNYRGKKLGVSSARNAGAKLAKGKYLLFLDDDDDFTERWILDFLSAATGSPDLVFCQMIRKELNGKGSIEVATITKEGKLNEAIFIPGAWLIKKDFFIQLGGYDDRLTYAENTELFIRIQNSDPVISLIDSPNFIYYPSPDGGSKNLKNMVDSLLLILEKHHGTLSPHVKHLYHQIIGVNSIRFRQFSESRKHLISAIRYKPWKASTYGRFLIACFPFLAKKIYSEKVKFD